jgi:hypothetical protein
MNKPYIRSQVRQLLLDPAVHRDIMPAYVMDAYVIRAYVMPACVAAQVRQLLLDPAVHREFRKMRTDADAKAHEAKLLRQELQAVSFSQDSKTGRMLMAKCRTLQVPYTGHLYRMTLEIDYGMPVDRLGGECQIQRPSFLPSALQSRYPRASCPSSPSPLLTQRYLSSSLCT